MIHIELVNKIVAVSVGLLVAAIILPIALIALANTTWYGVNSSVVIFVTVLLPLLGVISIALYFLRD